jgi:hypothetical protein
MNDGKSIDETEALPLVEFGSSPTANPSEAKDLDQRRRRLIRGAAGVAPVLLTLRSGALLAASSCTGALTIVTTDPTTGKFAGVLDMQAGQVCAENPSQVGCPVGETKILTASDANKYRTVGPSGGEWTCEKSGPVVLKGAPVAILSNASATSLGFTP